MVPLSTATVQMEHIAFPHAMRAQLIKLITNTGRDFPELSVSCDLLQNFHVFYVCFQEMMLPFLERIKLIKFQMLERINV